MYRSKVLTSHWINLLARKSQREAKNMLLEIGGKLILFKNWQRIGLNSTHTYFVEELVSNKIGYLTEDIPKQNVAVAFLSAYRTMQEERSDLKMEFIIHLRKHNLRFGKFSAWTCVKKENSAGESTIVVG
jgi:hypothetical protein